MTTAVEFKSFAFSTIAQLERALADGTVTSVDLTTMFLGRIAKHDPTLNSFITVRQDAALAEAKASDARRAQGRPARALEGIPIALKDNIDVAGVVTTAGIEARRHTLAQADATVAAKLREAGAIILGKLNMHEGAHGATNANEAYGNCYNPHGNDLTPGGSSGGSGAAVAAGLCAAALGTDTLGSVRIPSSLCGIAGMKPTRGLVSTAGVVPLAWSLDHVGPMARSVGCVERMLRVITGPDPDDAFSQVTPVQQLQSFERPSSLRGVRLGRLRDICTVAGDIVFPDVEPAYEAALAALANLGAQIVDITLIGYDHKAVRPKAVLVMEADLAIFYAKELAENPLGFSQVFRDGIAFGQQQSAPKLAAAYATIRSVRPIAAKLFAEVDALVTPTTPCTAFPFSQKMPLNFTTFTSFANYVGAPAVSVPMGFSQNRLPLGLQIIARPFADLAALRIASAYEYAAQHDMMPAGY